MKLVWYANLIARMMDRIIVILIIIFKKDAVDLTSSVRDWYALALLTFGRDLLTGVHLINNKLNTNRLT